MVRTQKYAKFRKEKNTLRNLLKKEGLKETRKQVTSFSLVFLSPRFLVYFLKKTYFFTTLTDFPLEYFTMNIPLAGSLSNF